MLIPALALGTGSIIKIILNCYLVPINPNIFILGGTAGAAFATVVCHIISVSIEYKALKKEINLNLNPVKFIIKPVISTIIMSISTILLYKTLILKINQKLCLILTLIIGIVVYLICIFILKIFSKEEIFMIPFGKKIYNFISLKKS